SGRYRRSGCHRGQALSPKARSACLMEFRIPKTVLIVVVVAVLGVVAAAVAIPLTSAPKFCATCHIIKPSYDSWVKSSHKDVTCVACHVRPTFEGFVQDKVIKGTHDVCVTFFATSKKPEDLKATETSCVQVGRAHV